MTDPSRLARLNAIKLAALVRDHVGDDVDLVPGEFPGGAALRRADEAWVLARRAPARALGPALAWALRQGADVAPCGGRDRAPGSWPDVPRPSRCPCRCGTQRVECCCPPWPSRCPIRPPCRRPIASSSTPSPQSGADPHEEFGVLSGEVQGLEVCRVVDDPYTGRHPARGRCRRARPRGVPHAARRSPAPRGARRVVRGRHPAPAARRHRSSADPAGAGAAAAVRAWSAEPYAHRRHPGGAGRAAGAAPEPEGPGAVRARSPPSTAVAVAVVCSMGVDLDVVPYAVDARAALGSAAVPARAARSRRARRAAPAGRRWLAAPHRRPGRLTP